MSRVSLMRRTHPTRLIYPQDSRVQTHVCCSGHTADAITCYVRGKYHVRPAERIRDADLRLDPGGMAFLEPTVYRLTDRLPYVVRVAAEHVGGALVAFRTVQAYPKARKTLGGVEVVRVQMFHHAIVLLPDHVVVIVDWLADKASEADADTELRLQNIRKSDRVVIVKPPPIIGQT